MSVNEYCVYAHTDLEGNLDFLNICGIIVTVVEKCIQETVSFFYNLRNIFPGEIPGFINTENKCSINYMKM